MPRTMWLTCFHHHCFIKDIEPTCFANKNYPHNILGFLKKEIHKGNRVKIICQSYLQARSMASILD